MGSRISPQLARLLRERKLTRAQISRGVVLKEIEAAQTDLQDAKESLESGKLKWATIQGYYSMFHSARALLFSCGFREKSHHALLLAVRELFPNDLEHSLISRFEEGMQLRQEADYGLKFSETGAIDTIEGAEIMLSRAKQILKIK
jgi:uncharacterized protein (UPF0332 family)